MATTLFKNHPAEEFLARPSGDKQIRLNISRNTLLAFIVSILLHGLVMLLVFPKTNLNSASQATTIEVSLAPRTTAPVVEPQPVQAEPIPEPKTKIITQKPKSQVSKRKPHDFSVPKVLTTPQPSQQSVPTNPTPKPQPNSDAPTDMLALVNMRRAQRESQESDAARQNAAAAANERGPSEEEKRNNNIKNNFQTGTNGIFEIIRLDVGARTASFAFRGWTTDFNNSRKEFFDVEAKSGQDVRLVMIDRMISLIRQHYQGDFNWESPRLGRVIVLSARLEDTSGLENFMMTEFFGQNYKSAS